MAGSADRPSAFSGLQEGALVLADISGYSAFVAATEVDHSWSILHELLDTVVRSVQGRMDVSQVEGDAILFITGMSAGDVIRAIEETFVAFHRRLRDMQAVSTCPCNACANIGILKLKFVVHHGRFSRQRLGSVEQLHGTDVIVAHRLLKNKVPSKEYVLVTDAVLERLPDEVRQRFHPHSEEFDLGAISGGYVEIAYLWEEARAAERREVLPEEAMLNTKVTVDAPIELVGRLMLQPRVMERYMGSDGIEAAPGARGTDLDSEFHCHHGDMTITVRVVSIEPGRELTLYSDKPVPMYTTARLAGAEGGRTEISRALLWDSPGDPEIADGLRQMIELVTVTGDAAMREVFEERARSSTVASG
jgi:uncharacterized protein YndB with AHSA1/START domain